MKKYFIPTLALALGITAAGVHGVSAQTLGVSSSTTASVGSAAVTATATSSSSAKIATLIARSDKEITARINSLNKLSARLAKFKHLTSDQRNSINASVQTSITAMNTLKTKIDADTDLSTLKTDAASITRDYRIYMVVMPSETTIAATDNALASITEYTATLKTLQTRITAGQTAGKNTTTVQASHDDAVAKLADAQIQSQTLINAVTSLKVDMGDKTVQANNKTQLAAAKTARQAMLKDLSAARKDIAATKAGLKTLSV